MPLSATHKKLLHSLLSEHASNKIVRRQVRRGIAYAKPYARKTAYAAGRQLERYGNAALGQALRGSGGYTVGRGIKGRAGGKMGVRRMTTRAKHSSFEKGEMRIKHSEYIGDLQSGGITGASTFTSWLLGINPGNAGSFPWLSSVANNFQEYKFNQLVFEYRPLISNSTSTSAATLTSMGTVCAAVQYDSAQPQFINKQQLENADGAASIKPSEKLVVHVECKPKYNPLATLYVNSSTAVTNTGVSNSDIRMQNLGYCQFASVGIPIASNTSLDLGEIWVHYDCTLLKPVLGNEVALQSGHYEGGASNISGSLFAGGAMTPTSTSLFNNITFTGDAFTFPPEVNYGAFLCVYYGVIGSSTEFSAIQTGSNWSVSPTGAGTISDLWEGSPADDCAQMLITADNYASSYVNAFIVFVTTPGSQQCTVTFNDGAGSQAANFTHCDFLITPWNIGVTN